MGTNMDEDIYAYEQEFNDEDEWEAMHAHEIEAAEEAMRAMDDAEAQREEDERDTRMQSDDAVRTDDDHNDDEDDPMDAEAKIARAQSRLNAVLERCATLLGETNSELPETEVLIDERLRHKHDQQKRAQQTNLFYDPSARDYLCSRPPIDVDSIPVVLSGGDRMFIRKKATSPFTSRTISSHLSVPIETLLSVPITELMKTIEQRQIEKAMETSSSATDKIMEQPSTSSSRSDAGVLWLDKYRPESFIDLLSDERTNREVLMWMKKWDAFVFPNKKDAAASSSATSSAFSQPHHANKENNNFRNMNKKPTIGVKPPENDVVDPRPHEKIILLCGPPGAGKTTLANIVARHAGYNPIEINASDDRTAGVLKNRIISAMEMQSIWGSRKPNCIILDEIDGAMNSGDGKTAIAAIQEIIAAPLQSKQSGGEKANSQQHPLTRPLICICNDQYASVLRPLRKVAKIFVLESPNQQRLVSRLKTICRHEGVQCSSGALAALCSAGGYDIRYCVNVLQFQHAASSRSRHKVLTKAMITQGNGGFMGQKDTTMGVSDAMDLVFYDPKARRTTTSTGDREAAKYQLIDEAVHAVGNYGMVMQSLHENLPKMIFNDPTMNKLCEAMEWMEIADAWETSVRSEQQFALTSYIPFAAMAVHTACCTSTRRRIQYPRSHFEAQKKHEKSLNIIDALLDNCRLHASFRLGTGSLAIDVIPWLLATLAPNVKRLNPSLQTQEEKRMIQRLIDLMASLGLSFRPRCLPDGTEDYAMEPPLYELAVFRGRHELDATAPVLLPNAVRKLISREVELEAMRRQEEAGTVRRIKPKVEKDSKTKTAQVPVVHLPPALTAEEEAMKLEAIRKRNPFAFAYREAKRKRDQKLKQEQQARQRAKEQQEEATTATNEHQPKKQRTAVRYKFHEGYTSGIKTTVYLRDLLL